MSQFLLLSQAPMAYHGVLNMRARTLFRYDYRHAFLKSIIVEVIAFAILKVTEEHCSGALA